MYYTVQYLHINQGWLLLIGFLLSQDQVSINYNTVEPVQTDDDDVWRQVAT